MRQNDANLQRAKANLVSQQSVLTEAEATLKRYQILMKSDAISRQELEQQQAKARAARAAVQAANAEIAQVQAQLDDSRYQRKKAEVLAPADGIAEILSGLKVGEHVVQKAGALINEGERVEPIVK